MPDLLVLDLVDEGLMTSQFVLTIGYDIENVSSGRYHGSITIDHYRRTIPKHAHGTGNLEKYSSSTREITSYMMSLYNRIVDKNLLVRCITICANHVPPEDTVPTENGFEQLDLFTDYVTAAEK